MINERTAEINRLHKTLEGANIKLASVVSDLTGQSAHAMLELLVAGTTDPVRLAACAQGSLKAKIPALEAVLVGSFDPHQRFLVARHLAHLDDLDRLIGELDAEVGRRLAPFEAEVALLDTIPGVGPRTAEELVAEIGRTTPTPGLPGHPYPRRLTRYERRPNPSISYEPDAGTTGGHAAGGGSCGADSGMNGSISGCRSLKTAVLSAPRR